MSPPSLPGEVGSARRAEVGGGSAALRVRRPRPGLLLLCRPAGAEVLSGFASFVPPFRYGGPLRPRFARPPPPPSVGEDTLCALPLSGVKVLSDFASRGCPLPACRGRWAQPVALRSEGVLPPFGYGGPRPGLLRLCCRSGAEAPSDLASLGHLPHLRWERTRLVLCRFRVRRSPSTLPRLCHSSGTEAPSPTFGGRGHGVSRAPIRVPSPLCLRCSA